MVFTGFVATLYTEQRRGTWEFTETYGSANRRSRLFVQAVFFFWKRWERNPTISQRFCRCLFSCIIINPLNCNRFRAMTYRNVEILHKLYQCVRLTQVQAFHNLAIGPIFGDVFLSQPSLKIVAGSRSILFNRSTDHEFPLTVGRASLCFIGVPAKECCSAYHACALNPCVSHTVLQSYTDVVQHYITSRKEPAR